MKFWKFIPVVALTILASCKDSLTIEDLENRTVATGYYDSPQRIEQAVIGGYVDLRRALLADYAWAMYGEARTGDLNVNVPFGQSVFSQELHAEHRSLYRISDWAYFYDVIKDANDVLKIVAEAKPGVLSEYQRNLFRGEALALKSLAYFYVARIWGDAPSAETNNFGRRLSNQELVSQAAVWAAEAKSLLPWMLLNDDGIESAAMTAVRFNRTAATAMLAHQELWLGNGQNAYTILNTTVTESTVDSLSSFGLSAGTDRRDDVPESPLAAEMIHMPMAKFTEIYPEGDERRSRYNVSASADRATLIPGDAEIFDLFPLVEIDLLLAEAAWRSGRMTEARQYLMEAAEGATEDYSAIEESAIGDAVLLERQRLLTGTGQRMFDLIRFGKVSTYIPQLSPADVNSGAAYWPVSPNSMKGMSWTQNSYWLSKN